MRLPGQTTLLIAGYFWATVMLSENFVVGDQESSSSSTETWRVIWRHDRGFYRRPTYFQRHSLPLGSASSEEMPISFNNHMKYRHRNSNNRKHRNNNKNLVPVFNDNSALTDVCNPNPCKNNGICLRNGNTFLCFCRSPFIGKTCHRFDLCSSQPCKHDGKCKQTGNIYTCRCPKQYMGMHCQLKNPCQPNLCQNEARCLPKDGTFQCQCHEAYLGELCELLNPCLPNPCSNNGKCHISGQSFSCDCQKPYTGQMCEVISSFQMFAIRDPCLGSPCQHDGLCTVAANGAVDCHCYPKYTGKFCEIPAEFPPKLGPKLTELLFWSGIDVTNMLNLSLFFAPTDDALLDIHAEYLWSQDRENSELLEFILQHAVPKNVFLERTQLQRQLEKVCGQIIDTDKYNGEISILIVNKALLTPSSDIIGVLSTETRFKRFYEYTKNLPRILRILKDATEANPVTLLIPTNRAIDAIPKEITEDERQIRWTLLYHIILGHVCFPHHLADDSKEYYEIAMYTETQDQVLLKYVNDNNMFVNDVNVIESDVITSNGVIHYIDNVLDPSFMRF